MPDYLATLDPNQVASFYRRLALNIQKQFNGDSLAAILLLHWLDGKGAKKTFPAKYVKDLSEVRDYLQNTARPIFLSQKNTPQGKTGGINPRISGAIPSNPPQGPYPMHLEGNVETPVSIEMKAAMGMNVNSRELDVLYALHGFQLVSDVVASASKNGSPRSYNVKFDRWICKTSDEYHWNPAKHITVPNPDYQSTAKDAVAPKEKTIVVFHSNAIRIEHAGLAAPFHDESEPWTETDPAVAGPSMITV